MATWKHTAQIRKTVKLIDETVEATGISSYGRDAKAVLRLLTKHKPKLTPLALSWISLASAELLEHRGGTCKLLLLMARAVTDRELLAAMMHLFHQAFHANRHHAKNPAEDALLDQLHETDPQLVLQQLQQAVGQLAKKLPGMPDGVSLIPLTEGVSAKVLKISMPKGKGGSFLDGNPRLN